MLGVREHESRVGRSLRFVNPHHHRFPDPRSAVALPGSIVGVDPPADEFLEPARGIPNREPRLPIGIVLTGQPRLSLGHD